MITTCCGDQRCQFMGRACFLVVMAFFLSTPLLAGERVKTETAEHTTPLPVPVSLTAVPASFVIHGADDTQRLLVTGLAEGSDPERTFDFSRKATYTSSDNNVVTVSGHGVVTPRGNGTAEIRINVGRQSAVAAVTVKDFDRESPVSFRNQIVPIFSKHGCNSGGC